MVSCKNRQYGARNPRSQYRDAISVEDVLAARPVAPPLTLLMCCPTSSGAAAAMIASDDVARQTHGPVRVVGSALMSDPPADPNDPLAGITRINSGVAQQAYEQAGVKPDQIDVAEVHDCFTVMGAIGAEVVGKAGYGEGARYWAEGRANVDGECAINSSGGLIAKGHPVGATGIAMIGWSAWQLLGKVPKELQVENARTAATFNIGGPICASVCTVLKTP